MNCSRRIYRGNAYEICLPLVDSGVTLVRIYTRGDVIIEKEPEITADSMCIQLTADELAGLADGVIRYEAITDTDAYVTNSPYILITPDWYSGRTIDDIIQDAYDSGYTDGQEACTGGTCEGVYESGYTDGYQSGYTRGYQTGYADGLAACESGDTGDTADLWLEDMQGNIIQGETFVIPATSGTFSFKVVCVDDDIMWEMYNMPLMGTGTTEVDFEIPTNPGPDFYMGFYLTSPGATVLEDSWFRIVFDGAEPFFTLSLDYSRVNPDNIISGSTNDLVIKNDRRTPGIGVLLVTNTGYTFDYEEMLTGVKDIIGGPFPISGFGGHRTLTLDVPAHETQRQYVFTAYYGDNTVAGRFTISQIPDPTPVPPSPDYSTMPVTFDIISGGTICYTKYSTIQSGHTIEYSVDDGNTWTSIAPTTEIQVSAGDKVLFRGDNDYYGAGTIGAYGMFSGGTALFNAYGNIMSLINSQNYESVDDLNNWAFVKFFMNCTGLVDAGNLILPAKTASDCYHDMFSGCTSLVTPPELPATTLAPQCYANMFGGCTSLTTAPDLPAMVFTPFCYYRMFQGCISLTTAPDIPATDMTDAESCCEGMFSGCTSLTVAPELKTNILVVNCYRDMFNGCTSLSSLTCLATDNSAQRCDANWLDGVQETGVFVKHPDMDSWGRYGPPGVAPFNGIPYGWTVVDAQL